MASLVVPIQLSWGDMDIFKHINNVAYARYMETGRALLIEHFKIVNMQTNRPTRIPEDLRKTFEAAQR